MMGVAQLGFGATSGIGYGLTAKLLLWLTFFLSE